MSPMRCRLAMLCSGGGQCTLTLTEKIGEREKGEGVVLIQGGHNFLKKATRKFMDKLTTIKIKD